MLGTTTKQQTKHGNAGTRNEVNTQGDQQPEKRKRAQKTSRMSEERSAARGTLPPDGESGTSNLQALFRALDPHRNDYVPPLWEISRLPLTSAKQFYCIGDSKPSCWEAAHGGSSEVTDFFFFVTLDLVLPLEVRLTPTKARQMQSVVHDFGYSYEVSNLSDASDTV